jgi:hypothetical protein
MQFPTLTDFFFGAPGKSTWPRNLDALAGATLARYYHGWELGYLATNGVLEGLETGPAFWVVSSYGARSTLYTLIFPRPFGR